jgi:predicted metal-dependent phosphotriesterase family hydrolase
MTLARDDRSMRIILTCRDYSVEQVRASFLQPARIAKQLKAAGVTDAHLHTIQVDNPRRFLAFVPKSA